MPTVAVPPIDQARARTKSYAETAKEFVPSTPGTKGECVVSAMFDKGDRRRCYLPCPYCGTFQALAYENMQAPTAETGGRATFSCIADDCRRTFGQDRLEWMEERLRWVPMRIEDGEAPVPNAIPAKRIEAFAIAPCTGRVARWQPSWALWSAYSRMERWTDIWQRGQDAKGDPLKEKAFTQQDLGEPYEPRTDTPDWQKLMAARTSWSRGTVVYPASVLAGFIDVQGNRFEWGVWAFGPGFQAWLVDRGVIGHSYQTDEGWRAIDALTGADLDDGGWNQPAGPAMGARHRHLHPGALRPRLAPPDAARHQGCEQPGRGALQDEPGRPSGRAGHPDRRPADQPRPHR